MKADEWLFYIAFFVLLAIILTGCNEIDPNAPQAPPPPRRECVKWETRFVPEPRITSYDMYGIPLGSHIIMRPRQECAEWKSLETE